jgi:hypothetical protein
MQAITTPADEMTIDARVAILRAAQILRRAMRAQLRGAAGMVNAARAQAIGLLQSIGMTFSAAVRAVLVEMRAVRAALA